MSSSIGAAAAPDAAVIAALELLEASRSRLHDALREAAFGFVAAQREEESTRGCFVAFDAVPTAVNTLSPLLTVSQAASSPADDAAAHPWVLTATEGGRKPATHAGHAAANEQATPLDAPAAVDPVHYFSEHPSSALRDCQAAYRRVLQSVVEVAGAQQAALAAAARYADGPSTKAL